MPPRLIFLKSPSPSALEDKYTRYVTSQGAMAPLYVPPLSSRLVSSAMTTLRTSLSSLDAVRSSYAGIILTSQRAVEALSEALSEAFINFDSSAPTSGSFNNSNLPVFVVGPATGSAVKESISARGFPVQVLGEESGSGAGLASYILEYFASTLPDKPLLYLVGETHDPGFAQTLRAGKVPVEELVVYGTCERAEFATELLAVVNAASPESRAHPVNTAAIEEPMDTADQAPNEANPGSEPCDGSSESNEEKAGAVEETWIVACAPSGLSAMLKAFGWMDDADGDGRGAGAGGGSGRGDVRKGGYLQFPKGIKVAAIGPKTDHFARTTFGFEVDAVAEMPTPQGVWSSIMEAEARGRLENARHIEDTNTGDSRS